MIWIVVGILAIVLIVAVIFIFKKPSAQTAANLGASTAVSKAATATNAGSTIGTFFSNLFGGSSTPTVDASAINSGGANTAQDEVFNSIGGNSLFDLGVAV